MIHLIGQLLFGLCVGALAKLLLPGKDPGGLTVTALIGFSGSVIGTLSGRALWSGHSYAAGWAMSIVGALLVLTLYRLVTHRRAAWV